MSLIKLRFTPTTDPALAQLQNAIQQGFTQLQAYAPSDESAWATPKPTTIQEALDRIADLLVTLNGGAIP